MRTRADSPTKFCTAEGCNGALRARGMCSTHYNNARHPDRHAPVPTPCVVCGVVVLRGVKRDRRHVCSPDCWATVAGMLQSGYDWTRSAMDRARKCGATRIEAVSRDDVFDRDRFTCQICGDRVTAPSPFDPRSATVDHVVPLSRGGAHSLENCQTACLRCNSSKQDRELHSAEGNASVKPAP